MTGRSDPNPVEVALFDLAPFGISALGRELAQQGMVFTLARLDTLPDGLAPPLPSESEASAHLPKPAQAGFLARRRIARSILGSALGIAAADIAVEIDALDRPLARLPDDLPSHVLSFSARGDLAMIGLMRQTDQRRCLGVDIENGMLEANIPWNMLHADERSWLEAAPARAERMTWLWTLKEAAVKALGQGFRIPPEEVGVHLPEFGDLAALKAPVRLFLRNHRTNSDLETATVLTWRVQSRLKELTFDPGLLGDAYSLAAAVVLGSGNRQGT